MATGYLVTLGDGSLDAGDSISGSQSTFNIDSTLGAGSWNWSGVWDGDGQFYSNIDDTGVYYLGDDGNVYFIPDTWYTTSGTATATSAPAYTASNGIVDGTDAGEVIDASYTDGDGEQVDAGDGTGPGGNEDEIRAGGGDDTISSGLEDDLVYGGSGSDVIDGGAGADTIYGDSDPSETGPQPVSIDDSNYADTTNGYTVTAQNVVGGVLTAPDVANVGVYSGGGFGANGTISDSDSSVFEQTGYDKASGLSEVLSVQFDNPVDEASFSFGVLFTQDFGEVGHWAIYDGGALVAEGDFTEDVPGSGSGTVNLAGFGPFDEIQFTGLLQTDGTDGSDFVITDVTFTPAAAPSTEDDTISGGDGDDVIYGEEGADSLSGGAGNDLIYGGAPNGSTGIGGSNNVGNSFTVINLGSVADIDPDESNGDSENAAALLGSYGGAGTPLYQNFQDAITNDIDGDSNVDDNDGGNTPEAININGTDYFVDSAQVYNATVTFTDGTTGSFTAVVFQTTDGQVFMAPEMTDNADNALLTSAPIESISLDSVAISNTNLASSRLDADYQVPASEVSNDTLDGGTGADTMHGQAGDDQITVAEGDSATGGDGDDTFIVTDLGEAGASGITVVGGEGDETVGDTLDFNGQLDWGSLNITNADDAAGGLSGTATLKDGTVVTFSEIETIICFTAGTLIRTPHGPRKVEDLRPGDLVVTRDNGVQPVRWAGRRTVRAEGGLAPVRIRAGALGNSRDLLVSPQHRLLYRGPETALYFHQPEVLVAAKGLVNGRAVTTQPGGLVTYVHLMFDRHEIVFAEDMATESFYPGATGLDAIEDAAREELFTVFPELRSNTGGYGPTARFCVTPREAALLRVA